MTQVTLALIILGVIVIVYLYRKIGRHGLGLIGLIAVLLVGYAFFVVHSISSDPVAATVTCHQVANQSNTMVVTLNGETYELNGTRWMLQTSVVQVQDWAYFLGIRSGYTLDRLNGQFDDNQQHGQKPIELGGFSLYKSTELWRYVPLIKSSYGNGIILPCDSRTYSVKVDPEGSMHTERS